MIMTDSNRSSAMWPLLLEIWVHHWSSLVTPQCTCFAIYRCLNYAIANGIIHVYKSCLNNHSIAEANKFIMSCGCMRLSGYIYYTVNQSKVSTSSATIPTHWQLYTGLHLPWIEANNYITTPLSRRRTYRWSFFNLLFFFAIYYSSR